MPTFLNSFWIYRRHLMYDVWIYNQDQQGSLKASSQVFDVFILSFLWGHAAALVHRLVIGAVWDMGGSHADTTTPHCSGGHLTFCLDWKWHCTVLAPSFIRCFIFLARWMCSVAKRAQLLCRLLIANAVSTAEAEHVHAQKISSSSLHVNYVCVLFIPCVHSSIKFAIDFLQHEMLILSPWLLAICRDCCFSIFSVAFLTCVIGFVEHQHHCYCIFWKFILLSTCFDLILDSSIIPHDYREEIITISIRGLLINWTSSGGGQSLGKVQISHPHQFFTTFPLFLLL